MKKKISFILAAAMALTMLAGCKKTDEETSGLPEAASESVTLTAMTTTEATTTTAAETTTETTTETSDETTSESESETTSETTSATAAASTTTATAGSTTGSKAWNETEISETMYITTACYSRKEAIVGSESVKKYEPGQKINIVAATDTGYYKLADGTFIHSDYVTDQAPAGTAGTAGSSAATSAEATTTKKVTTVTTQEEFDTGTTAGTAGGNTSSGSKLSSASYTRSYKDRYPYKQLSKAEQTLYADIVAAAESYTEQVTVPDSLTSNQIFKVYCLVYNQEPQLFWLSNTMPWVLGGTMNLEFDLTPDEIKSAQSAIDSNVKSVMNKVKGYSSTVSKLKVIYDWVVTNNDFDLQGTFKTCGIYNGLGNSGKLQCQGYAKSVLYLCDMAGIDCMVVTGTGHGGTSHAWNVVYCDNGYYILDTTLGDPYGLSYAKSDYCRYMFFLANDEMAATSHLDVSIMYRADGTPVKLFDPPACTKTACYYFKAYNKEYSDLDSAVAGMYKEIDEAIKNGKNVAHIRVTDHDLWETLTSNDYAKKFQKYAKEKDSSVTGLNRQKTVNEDILVVQYDIMYK